MTAPLLDDRLRALGDALAHADPPESVDRAIAAAIEKRRSRPRGAGASRLFERWLAWPLALAASIFLIAFVVRHSPPAALAPAVEAQALRQVAKSFVPVVPTELIARTQDAYVVPARIERSMLADLGLPVSPERIGESVDAELLVRTDGELLALRFVH